MKRFWSLVLSIVLLVFNSVNSINVSASSDVILSTEEAIEIAKMFVNSDVNVSVEETFKDNIIISAIKELYDIDDEVVAYLIQFCDAGYCDAGYVIVGATKTVPAIIEFAHEGTCFLSEVEKYLEKENGAEKGSISFYYNGDANYYAEVKNGDENSFYYIGNELHKLKKGDVKEKREQKNIYEYEKEWSNIEKTIRVNQGKSSTTPSNSIIYSPSAYETGYTSLNISNVPNATGITYYTTSDFSGNNHCGPTAGVNFLLYWYNQGYTNLLQSSWSDVFNVLYADMKTATNGTTYATDFLNAIKDYLDTYASGYSSAKYYSSVDGWSRISTEIDDDYPVVLLLQSHNVYGNHYVLGLGYREYVYSDSYSRYIRIADGWGANPTRYVHFTIGYADGGGMDVLKIRPE